MAKIICFRCRRADCGCVASSNFEQLRPKLTWAFAWLGGACVAGGAFGAVMALFFS